MNLRRLSGIGILSLALYGCGDPKPIYLDGVVEKECGSLSGNECSPFKGMSPHIGREDYSLIVRTKKGEYYIDVSSSMYTPQSLSDLEKKIKVGTKIRFQTNPHGIEQFQQYKNVPGIRGRIEQKNIDIIE